MCAPRDQRKSSNNQAEHAELNGLRSHRVVDISGDAIALGKPSLVKLRGGKSQNERLWNGIDPLG
jgi:hypothetical protein